MPALSATYANKPIKALYERIKDRNPEIKKKGIVAGMRKLLTLTYTLWKKDEEFEQNHQWNYENPVSLEQKKRSLKAPHEIDNNPKNWIMPSVVKTNKNEEIFSKTARI